MRTVRYSGRLMGGRGRGTLALLPPVDRILFLTHAFESITFPQLPLWTVNITNQQECIPVGCIPSTAVAFSSGGGGGGVPVDRIFDTRLWKHYLSVTTVADGKYSRLLAN